MLKDPNRDVFWNVLIREDPSYFSKKCRDYILQVLQYNSRSSTMVMFWIMKEKHYKSAVNWLYQILFYVKKTNCHNCFGNIFNNVKGFKLLKVKEFCNILKGFWYLKKLIYFLLFACQCIDLAFKEMHVLNFLNYLPQNQNDCVAY